MVPPHTCIPSSGGDDGCKDALACCPGLHGHSAPPPTALLPWPDLLFWIPCLVITVVIKRPRALDLDTWIGPVTTHSTFHNMA